MSLYYIALALCVVCSAFFSAAEMSISSANRLRLENMRDNGSRRAARALRLVERYDAALSTILIGNNLVNVAASSLSSVIAILIAASSGLSEGLCTTAATICVTLLVIIFGETMPKIVAKKNANSMVLAFSGLLQLLEWILRPLVWCVVSLVSLIARGVKSDAGEDDAQEAAVEELQSIIETAEDEEVLDEDRSELLQAALDFSDISASEAMTARVDMMALDIEDDWEELCRQIDEAPFSRLPVYEGDTDNIIGVLHLNAFYRALLENEKPDIRSLLSEPCWVYKTVKLPKVLDELRRRKTHLAIVTDEYGGTAGVLSMEDILEELVGEIWDETDEVEPEIVEKDNGELILDGDMSVYDFLELAGLDEANFDFESETIGGWTMEMLDGFAQPGDHFEYEGFSVTVLETDDKRVEKLRVVPPQPTEEENND